MERLLLNVFKLGALIYLVFALSCFIVVEFELPIDVIGFLATKYSLTYSEVKQSLQVASLISLFLICSFLFIIYPEPIEKAKK